MGALGLNFVPKHVPGCLLWVRGDMGITQSGGNCTAWADQSGCGNNLVSVGTIPFVASSINGRPGNTCAPNSQGWRAGKAVLSSGTARTLVAVVKPSSTVGGVVFSCRSSADTEEFYFLGTGGSVPGLLNSNNSATGYATITARDDTANPLYLEYSKGALGKIDFWINGGKQTVTQATATTSDTGTAEFGFGYLSQIPTLLGFTGDLDEGGVWERVLEQSERNRLRKYVASRYNIKMIGE